MKTLFISLGLFLSMSLSSLAETSNYSFIDASVQEEQSEQSIQSRIMAAFQNSFVVQSNSEMLQLIDEISSSYEKSQNPLFLYWKGYACYYNSIYYLKNGDKDRAHEELKNGINAMETNKIKNSEDCALLSMMYSFSCSFVVFPKVIIASKKANDYIEKAMELDNKNPRVYYVMANNDYYTPETYGGGEKVEENAIKALSFPAQEISNPYLPSWGRQESYELLVSHYMKNGNLGLAKKYVELGLAEFPDSYTLKYNKSKLP